MNSFSDKDSCYKAVRACLESVGFVVEDYREIQFGLQFDIFLLGKKSVFRIYEGKKGVRLDLSQVKNADQIKVLYKALDSLGKFGELAPASKKGVKPFPFETSQNDQNDPDDLIGIDESGKGDYFGPLVVAAVHVSPEMKGELEGLGVRDSKTMDDGRIEKMAVVIQKKCAHSLVILRNQTYNEIYATMKNLNHLLAWGHARVLENVLNQVSCTHALSDQFGDSSLVKNALMVKGKAIVLLQRPKAESNIAVAAASILARAAFVSEMRDISERLEMVVPKGCSDRTVKVARKIVEDYGAEILEYTAKLHFKITKEVLG